MSKRNLWKVPVFCLAASWVCYYLTIYLGGFIFGEREMGADGIIQISVNQLRADIFHGALFLAALLAGGIWFRRSMSRREIAVSALMASAVYLLLELLLSCSDQFSVSQILTFSRFCEWNRSFAAPLLRLTDNQAVSYVAAALAPLLFILFGKKAKA